MGRIFTLGESLLDIIHKDGREVHAIPGGSVLNTSITLGRLGSQVHLISEFGLDDDGEKIDTFLRKNGVDTSYVYRHSQGKTTRALAFLNQHNEASYRFEKYAPPHRLKIQLPDFNPDDILLFGSWFAIDPDLRSMVLKLTNLAQKRGAFVMYDPNFRNAHRKELPGLRDAIMENISLADLVRGSHEDFMNIFGIDDPHEVFEFLKEHLQCLIYTASHHGVDIFDHHHQKHYSVPDIRPVSTIGAGDNFNAGVLFGINRKALARKPFGNINETDWDHIMTTAIACSTKVCMTTENYVPEPFARHLRSQYYPGGFESK